MLVDRAEIVRLRELQWGRDVSIPEILPARRNVDPTIPLQWGRDVSIPEITHIKRYELQSLRFNGAGMFPSQK